MFGGINNPALFNLNDRMARDKLSKMAGIMASSTELLNSQLNNPMRAMPQPMTTPPNIRLPEMRMASLSPVQPTRKPMGVAKPPIPKGPPTPPNQKPAPKMLSNGGPTTPNLMEMFKQGAGSGNITQTPSPMAVPQAFAGLYELIKNMMPGSEEQVKEDITKISKATNGTTEEKTKAVTSITGQPPTEEGVKESYKIVTGNKAPERLSIDELDDRIMKVLVSGSLAQPGSLGARIAQAYALGLAGKRETAMLRAGAGKTGSGGKTVEPFQNAVIRVFNDIMASQFNADPDVAMSQAIQQVSRLYGMDPSTVAPGSIPIPGTTTTPGTPQYKVVNTQEEYDALKPGTIYIDKADGKPYKKT